MSFPVATKQGQVVVGGKTADVVVSHFGSHVLLCVSHFHKFGNLVLVTKETVANSNYTYTIKTILGNDNEMLQVLSRGIAELVHRDPATPPSLLLAVALDRQLSPAVLKEVITSLEKFGIGLNKPET